MNQPSDRLAEMGRRTLTAGRSSGLAAATAVSALASGGQHGLRLFRERYPTVAVTGMSGVGKTVLVDRLCHRDSAQGPVEAGSAVMERRTRTSGRFKGFRFRVVPGDNAATRLTALDEVFHDEPVDGVLHVVANGYATGRHLAGVPGRVEADRPQQLARELEDWIITAHRLASMAVRRDRHTWLVIAVTKVDLYPHGIEAAVRSYSPGSGTAFGDQVDQLQRLAGAAKLAIDVVPVCATAVKGGPVPPKQRDAYLAALQGRMEQFSGHV